MLLLVAIKAEAQLNSNPWLEANDEEDLEAVYNKKRRREMRGAVVNYEGESSVTIDRTHAYIQEEDNDSDKSLLDKVKDKLSGKKEEEKPLLANTKENRQKVAIQKQLQEQKEGESDEGALSVLDISKQTQQLQRSINKPLNKAKNMFNKFKRNTQNSLRAIGKKLR